MTPADPQTLMAIEELKPLAKKLNAESNDLNEIISTVSEKLAALNLGIEVWFDNFDGDKPGPGDTQLGFARIEDGGKSSWSLAVRTYSHPRSQSDSFGVPWQEGEPLTHADTPLTKASRDLRIEGLQRVPAIVQQLRRQAEQKLKVIEGAKQLAAEM